MHFVNPEDARKKKFNIFFTIFVAALVGMLTNQWATGAITGFMATFLFEEDEKFTLLFVALAVALTFVWSWETAATSLRLIVIKIITTLLSFGVVWLFMRARQNRPRQPSDPNFILLSDRKNRHIEKEVRRQFAKPVPPTTISS